MIHFLGIGGVGMAGVAALLKLRGEEVTGCDLAPTPRTRWLEGLGIRVQYGHSPEHLCDELVVTPAIREDNCELAAAKAKNLKIRRRGEVLAELVSETAGVAICGTHGKTTTTLFAAKLLLALGDDIAWCIGSESRDLPIAGVRQTANCTPQTANSLVAEADESDGTLALYRPGILVINAVDFDHLEHFASEEAYFECYRAAIRNTKGTIIVCADHPRAVRLVEETALEHQKVVKFGAKGATPAIMSALGENCAPHNVLNALAAVAVAAARGHKIEDIEKALPEALDVLPARRFELVRDNGFKLYTDYAHHPAELKCAVEMAKNAAKGGKLRVLFQPHRYSRTKALLREFPEAFAAADETVLVPVYPAFEDPIEGGDIADLYAAFREIYDEKRVFLAVSKEEAFRHALLTAKSGDVVLLAGAGDIIDVIEGGNFNAEGAETPQRCAGVELKEFSFFRTGGVSYGGGRKIPVGMGSNMWISDLATRDEYVKAHGNAAEAGARFIEGKARLAFMRGIPGTLGGWVKMNAGAFGHEIGEFVENVRLADGRVLSHDECGFGYRTSKIEGLIEEVYFNAEAADAVEGCGEAAEPALRKRPNFPPRCCGSVFKNPAGDYAGRLLEAVGAKGMKVGGAEVWEGHANVIFAKTGANSSDILALARILARKVYFRFGTRLEPEIRGLKIW